jgi:SNF2-related domain
LLPTRAIQCGCPHDRRITPEDARRQEVTAQEILLRLARQPGVVLADEVGMGKTFVALAVAASVALSDKQRRPIVVMVPPSLRLKWPRDFDVFNRECLPPDLGGRLKSARNMKINAVRKRMPRFHSLASLNARIM